VTGVEVGEVAFGDAGFVVIAGPCAVESEDQILQTARGVAAAGAKMLRGGAFKPRTSPYSFQGLAVEGLQLLARARTETGLRVVTEVMSVLQVETVAQYADMLQIGSRSMANEALLEEAGRCGLPVLLKRGMMATAEEFAGAAEILMAHGCPGVVLCERGIRTFGQQTRNTCDIAVVPLLQKMTGLPVIVDPSHATGRSDLVAPVCKAAVGVGADGLIVEAHPDPTRAMSDREQSLSVAEFAELMDGLQPHLEVWRGERGYSCRNATSGSTRVARQAGI
jgi:3-deoxy-7-phosphoheptulonate synthase